MRFYDVIINATFLFVNIPIFSPVNFVKYVEYGLWFLLSLLFIDRQLPSHPYWKINESLFHRTKKGPGWRIQRQPGPEKAGCICRSYRL